MLMKGKRASRSVGRVNPLNLPLKVLSSDTGRRVAKAVARSVGTAIGSYGSRYVSRMSRSRASTAGKSRRIFSPPARAPGYVKKVNYNTRGRIGRIRTTRRVSRPNEFQKYGTVSVGETGGVVEDDDVVYLGHHTTPITELMKGFGRAVTRRMAQDAKMDFTAFSSAQDLFPFNTGLYEWFIEYNAGAPATTTPAQLSLPINVAFPDFEGVAAILTGGIWGIVEGNEKIEIVKISMRSILATPRVVLFEIRGKDVSMKYYCSSKLSMQNRTVASNAVDNIEATNVANNPLVGFAYEGKGNAMRPRTNNVGTTFPSTIANLKQGIIISSSALLGPATGPTDVYKKPLPPNSFQNVSKYAKFTLNPGEIKTSFIKSTMNYRMNDFFANVYEMLSNYTAAPVSSDRRVTRMGTFKCHSMEKYLDSRFTGNKVSVAYQLDTKICCRLSVRKYCIGVPSNTIAATAGVGP